MRFQALFGGFCCLFILLLPEFNRVALASLPKKVLFDRGRPGCWDDIRGSVLTDAEVRALPEDCRILRTDYSLALKLVQKNKKEFQKQIANVLTHSKSVAPPYEAILFATFIGNDLMKSALKARAETEVKLNVAFKYAEAALFRLQGNACEDRKEYLHPFYREVCIGKDSILESFYREQVSK